MISKVKDWLENKGGQFEVLETKPLNPGVIKSGKDYYIQRVRRLKDDKEFRRGVIINDTIFILSYKDKQISCVYLSKFDYDLIHVDLEILFKQTVKNKDDKDYVPNEIIRIEINQIDEKMQEIFTKEKKSGYERFYKNFELK